MKALPNSLDDFFMIGDLFERKTKKIYYYNGGASFDCETSNTNINGQKIAFMYIWQLCINNAIVYGRTWEEFVELIDKLKAEYQLSAHKIIRIYIHNMAFDFQFIRKWFEWTKVFAIEQYKPLYAIMEGIEFRCSYQLSGQSLDHVAKDLHRHSIKKLIGDLDYDVIRTSSTKLSPEELEYCFNDVLIGQYYIDEQIEQYGAIWHIPLTNTGRVRGYCREQCLYKTKSDGMVNLNKNYRRLIKALTIEPDEYIMLKQAFQGGFTHANVQHVGQLLSDVTSFDFTSSYPAVMVSEFYPMSKGEKVIIKSLKQIYKLKRDYCLIFNVRYVNIRQKADVYENYLSSHKCVIEGERILNNGRIVSADSLTTTVTDVDFEIIRNFYDYDKIEIGTCYRYIKSRLPREFLMTVMDLYRDKTTLKDVKGMEVDYQLKKGMLNSTYGMTVTDIVRDVIDLGDDWSQHPPDLNEALSQYNRAWSRFLFYPWGVFITAYARRNLFTGIYAAGRDYVYADTDSVKLLNYKKHEQYFINYNKRVEAKMRASMRYLHLDVNDYAPITKKGVVKPLGVWDNDGVYKHFKTLGAKRYMVEDDSGYHLTVAGLPKKSGMEDILRQADEAGCTPFDIFNTDLTVSEDKTGKLTHSYIDDEIEGDIIDYQGVKGHYHEKSYIHLEKAPFSMSIAADYAEYIRIILERSI